MKTHRSPAAQPPCQLRGKTTASAHIVAALLVSISLALPGMALAEQKCVLGLEKTTPDSRYTDLKDGTVKDNDTGLIWQRCSVGQSWDAKSNKCTGDAKNLSWQQALKAAKALGEGWRLPNVKELASLIESSCKPAINIAVFPINTAMVSDDGKLISKIFWSGTPSKRVFKYTRAGRVLATFENEAYVIDFEGGSVAGLAKVQSGTRPRTAHARAVKSEK